MTKSELVSKIAAKTSLSQKDAELFLNAFKDVVADALGKGDKIQLLGFGTFLCRVRAERSGRNPRTNETIVIPQTVIPVFKPGKDLKDAVANP